MAGSMGVYLPTMLLHKALGLGRVLLFAYLLRQAAGEYGLWSLGVLLFSLLGPLMCLGSNHGLSRYVSAYESAGRLREFYRRVRWGVLACGVSVAGVALAASGPITRAVIASCRGMSAADFHQQLMICWAAIANAFVLALYYNLLAFLGGMRLYRLVSAVEIACGVLFAALGAAGLLLAPTGLALLAAHLAAVTVALAGGVALLHVAVGREGAVVGSGESPPPAAPDLEPALVETAAEGGTTFTAEPALLAGRGAEARGGFLRVLRFGLVALIGSELWTAASHLSFWLTSHFHGTEAGEVFFVFRQLSEPIAFVCAAAWTVVFAHVVRHWEGGRKEQALANLQTSFKAVSLGTMTLAVLVLLASPLWLRLLSPRWRQGASLLPAMLLFYQVTGNLGLLNMAAWLLKRPAIPLLPALAAGGLNLLLALLWLPAYRGVGAAWAAGVGMLIGGGGVAAACLLASRLKLAPSTYVFLLMPAVLLLSLLWPAWAVGAVWAAVLVAAVATDWLFDRGQKALLLGLARRAIGRLRNSRS